MLATDTAVATSAGISAGAVFNLGEGGKFWAKDNSLFLVKTGGGVLLLFYVDTALVHAKGCSPATPCVKYTGIKTLSPTMDATHFSTEGLAFSSVSSDPANTILELAYSGLLVNKLTVNGLPGCATTHNCTLTRTPYVDFSSDSPVACSILPADYHSNDLWVGLFNTTDDGSVGFAMGGAAPWHSATTYTLNESFILPNTSPNNAGNWAFQATAVSGQSGGTEPTWCQTSGCTIIDNGNITWTNIGKLSVQGQGFDAVIYKPTKGCRRLNTRIGKIYNGTGVSDPAGTLVTDSPSSCFNLTGTASSSCALTDIGTMHGGQLEPNPKYFHWTPNGAGSTVAAPFNGKQSCKSSTGVENYCYIMMWQTDSNVVRPCNEYTNQGSGNVVGQCDGHGINGYNTRWSSGVYAAHSYGRMHDNTGAPYPGTRLAPNGFDWDQHSSYNNVDVNDTNPPLMAMSDIPSFGRLPGTGYTVAGYNEEVFIKTDGSGQFYRVNHNWNSGVNASFGVQNAFAVVSPDATFLSVVSDMMETRGQIVSPATQCTAVRADIKWTGNTSIANGVRLFPITNNTNQSIYQNNGSTATTGSSYPNFNNAQSLSSTIVDGGVTWTNIGNDGCRGDIFIVDVSSAKPKP